MSLESILIGKKYTSIEIFSDSNSDKYAFLEAEQKKNEVHISKKQVCNDITQLGEIITKTPIILIINNDQVLQKEVIGKDENDKKVIHQAFPNLKMDEFIYEIWRKENSMVIAICRKSYLDRLLEDLDFRKHLVGVSLGVCSISSIKEFAMPETLYTNSQVVSLNSEQNSINTTDKNHIENFNINGLIVPNTHLLAFCGILKLIIGINNTEGSVADFNSEFLKNYQQKSFFQKGLTISTALIVLLLFINFFAFTYYFNNSKRLSEELAINGASVETIRKVKQRIADKEYKLKNFAKNNTSNSSLIINDIAKTVPSSILLSELQFHPLEKKIKAQETIILNDGLIIVSGHTVSSESFTNWISSIEKKKFIDRVKITSFSKDDNKNINFKISIKLTK